jgi:hypothetical protein
VLQAEQRAQYCGDAHGRVGAVDGVGTPSVTARPCAFHLRPRGRLAPLRRSHFQPVRAIEAGATRPRKRAETDILQACEARQYCEPAAHPGVHVAVFALCAGVQFPPLGCNVEQS